MPAKLPDNLFERIKEISADPELQKKMEQSTLYCTEQFKRAKKPLTFMVSGWARRVWNRCKQKLHKMEI